MISSFALAVDLLQPFSSCLVSVYSIECMNSVQISVYVQDFLGTLVVGYSMKPVYSSYEPVEDLKSLVL